MAALRTNFVLVDVDDAMVDVGKLAPYTGTMPARSGRVIETVLTQRIPMEVSERQPRWACAE